jgi:hypothetical protein
MKRVFRTSVALFVAWMTARVAPADEEVRRRIVEVRCERAGKVFVLGDEIISGRDDSPENVVVRIFIQERTFRPLRVGDRVRDGQLVVFVDDDNSAAVNLVMVDDDLFCAQNKLKQVMELRRNAEAEVLKSERSLMIVRHKFAAGTPHSDVSRRLVEVELDSDKADLERFKKQELDLRKECSRLEQRLRQAHAELERYQVCAVRGRVTKILTRPGQTVQAGDVILQIEVDAADDRRAVKEGQVKPAD